MRSCRRSRRRPNAGRSESTRRPVPRCQRPDEGYKCWHSHYHPDKHTHHWLKFTFRKEKITLKKRHRNLFHLRLETIEHTTDPSSVFISETKLTAGRPVPFCYVLSFTVPKNRCVKPAARRPNVALPNQSVADNNLLLFLKMAPPSFAHFLFLRFSCMSFPNAWKDEHQR